MNEIDPSHGKTTIAPEVLLTIAQLTTLNVDGVSRLSHVQTGVNKFLKHAQKREGVLVEVVDDVVHADIYVVLKYAMLVTTFNMKYLGQFQRW
jgi:uncharacterized alkaline shock family protein YloU